MHAEAVDMPGNVALGTRRNDFGPQTADVNLE